MSVNISKTSGAMRILDYCAIQVDEDVAPAGDWPPAFASRQARIIFRPAFSNQTIPWPPPVP
ncbi:MAG: hypothetical protein ACLPT6_10515 [Desulfobaccales bacterium]